MNESNAAYSLVSRVKSDRLLGFKHLLDSGKEDVVLKTLQKIRKRAGNVQETLSKHGTKFTSFSDCVVLSHPLNGGVGATIVTLLGIYLASELLRAGVLTRGGVTIGDLHHEGDILFGPSMVEAYLLESKQANYPRILVTDSVRMFVDAHQKTKAESQGILPEERGALASQIFRRDFDGLWHLDIFCPDAIHPGLQLDKVPPHLRSKVISEAMANAVLNAHEAFEAAPIESAKPKYGWLLNYFNSSCMERGWPTTWTKESGRWEPRVDDEDQGDLDLL